MTKRHDLMNCEDEPIRTPDLIQPHGILLIMNPQGIVEVVSENADQILGTTAERCLNAPFSRLFSVTATARLQAAIDSLRQGEPEMGIQLNIERQDTPFEVDAYLSLLGEHVLLELEKPQPASAEAEEDRIDILAVQTILSRLGRQSDVVSLADAVVREVRAITGFDRIMVYRFHADFHGEVIAESLVEGWESYLGLHYPESDIPRQARELYCAHAIRSIADVSYEPVPLRVSSNTGVPLPIDLSASMLRSVSPIHVQYLHNMGVGSSMSISLMDGDTLWGLIACHHRTPRHFSYRARKACELLGTTFSLMLLQLEDAEHSRELVRLQAIEHQLLGFMSTTVPFIDGAFRYLPNLSDMTNADGSASASAGEIMTIGSTPSREQISAFVAWYREREETDVFERHRLCDEFPPAADWDNDIRGVLLIEVSRINEQYLVCFRRKTVTTVAWAGNPNKSILRSDVDGRLQPRESFAAWSEEVNNQSLPWTRMELTVAKTLRQAVLRVIVDHSREVAQLNRQLEQSNESLQTFAETAAHDLKEPLRGIDTYLSFILEDHGDRLDDEMKRKLAVINSLANRGHELTNALLSFAEVGSETTRRRPVSLEVVLDEVMLTLESQIRESGVEIYRPAPLPGAWADLALITQVFQNLLSNALKYTRQHGSRIEIGALDALPDTDNERAKLSFTVGDTVIYCRDNGIGIADEHMGEIFKLFKRLHPRDRYGGGNGIGLSIAKRIVEYHNGCLWAHSTLGEGSTFYFTLRAAPAEAIE